MVLGMPSSRSAIELPLPGRRCGFWVKTPVNPNEPRPSSVAKVGAIDLLEVETQPGGQLSVNDGEVIREVVDEGVLGHRHVIEVGRPRSDTGIAVDVDRRQPDLVVAASAPGIRSSSGCVAS